jgi:hypothetical protein
MNFNLFKSESKLAFPRCEHRSPSGRQCSRPVCSTDPHFCGTHKPSPEQLTTTELTEAAGTLSSPDEIHRFLKVVLLNRVRGRITPKEASVCSYLCQNLLRSLREIDRFRELQSEREERNRIPENFGWSLPRPDRSDYPEATTSNSVVHPTAIAAENVGAASCPEHREGSARLPLPAESPAATSAPVSASSTISSASDAAPAAPASPKPPISIIPPTPTPPLDPSHFYPFDPTLKRGSQNPDRNIPPPDEAECRRLAARRGLDFKRRSLPGALR